MDDRVKTGLKRALGAQSISGCPFMTLRATETAEADLAPGLGKDSVAAQSSLSPTLPQCRTGASSLPPHYRLSSSSALELLPSSLRETKLKKHLHL